jgi:adenylate cyclase class IV
MFSREKYDEVKAFLDARAECLGEDDKDVAYFIFSDRLLKVVHNMSKGDAKISLKLNRIGEGAAFEEMEFHFSENDFELAKKIFHNLKLPAKCKEEAQQRINYAYKGCEIALKYGETWGYHLEIEKMIVDVREQEVAEQEIRAIASELGVALMTEDELRRFVANVERGLP